MDAASQASVTQPLPATPCRTLLAHGGVGADHLRRAADAAMRESDPALARRLTLAAWGASPLDARLAQAVAALPDAPQTTRELAAHVLANTRPPERLDYYLRLVERREDAKIERFLADRTNAEPDNLFWTRLGLAHALDREDFERAGALCACLPEPLARLLGCDTALLARNHQAALANASRCARLWDAPGLALRTALALLGLGDRPAALAQLAAALADQPWNANALLALYDLAAGVDTLRRPLPGRVAILLYTWNKAQDLERTLAAVAPSLGDGATLCLLDNGSTDTTPDIAAAWAARLGPRMHSLRLPVNVGAPAARNWLCALPQVAASDFAVFLDDDASPPPDWLELLGAARERYPDAGVWGCRVLDASRPAHIQSADVFLEALPDAGPGARRFTLSACHHQTLDMGQFAHLRPCATVTGCCHLFDTPELLGTGGFDLRFSPSQYDDLDHDIRLLLAGKVPAYQGHLAVAHHKSTGAQGGVGQAQYGVGWANQYKLHQKHTPEQFARAAALADRAALDDLAAKRAALRDILPGLLPDLPPGLLPGLLPDFGPPRGDAGA